jgi:hypothetical protein
MTVDLEQLSFDGIELPWVVEWRGMPEFIQEDLTPRYSVIVHFESDEDLSAFSKLVAQTVTPNTRSLWYPEAEIGHMMDKRYALAEAPR